MCKVVSIFNQTFIQNDDTKSSGTFKFMRILKKNHLQKFRIKVLGISDLTSSLLGGTLYLKNLPIVNTNCNTQTDLHTSGTNDLSGNVFYFQGTGNNNFYLGTLNQSFYTQPELLIENLPLDEFNIVRSVAGAFIVSIQVEVLDN